MLFSGLPSPRRARPAVGDLVVVPLVLHRLLARQDLAHDRHVLARARERPPVRDAVPALDHLRPGGPEPEDEAPAREGIERHRRHRRHRRRARRHLHDRRAELDLAGLRRDPGERRDGVVAVRLGRPDRVDSRAARPRGSDPWEPKAWDRTCRRADRAHGGLLRGCRVSPEGLAPAGGPRSYRIRGLPAAGSSLIPSSWKSSTSYPELPPRTLSGR